MSYIYVTVAGYGTGSERLYVYFYIKSNILFKKHILRKVDMTQTSQILERGESKIIKTTAKNSSPSGHRKKRKVLIYEYPPPTHIWKTYRHG